MPRAVQTCGLADLRTCGLADSRTCGLPDFCGRVPRVHEPLSTQNCSRTNRSHHMFRWMRFESSTDSLHKTRIHKAPRRAERRRRSAATGDRRRFCRSPFSPFAAFVSRGCGRWMIEMTSRLCVATRRSLSIKCRCQLKAPSRCQQKAPSRCQSNVYRRCQQKAA